MSLRRAGHVPWPAVFACSLRICLQELLHHDPKEQAAQVLYGQPIVGLSSSMEDVEKAHIHGKRLQQVRPRRFGRQERRVYSPTNPPRPR